MSVCLLCTDRFEVCAPSDTHTALRKCLSLRPAYLHKDIFLRPCPEAGSAIAVDAVSPSSLTATIGRVIPCVRMAGIWGREALQGGIQQQCASRPNATPKLDTKWHSEPSFPRADMPHGFSRGLSKWQPGH